MKTPMIFWILCLLTLMPGLVGAQDLPTGYLVWTKGDLGDKASRKIYRMSLPEKDDVRALTSGEDVECQISPGGKWVAFAKGKLSSRDYHEFNLWKIYIVSIHGWGEGREEIKIDDSGYWPSWGSDDSVLYYTQVDPEDSGHSIIKKVTLDDHGNVLTRKDVVTTRTQFPGVSEINECFMSPDERWFVARTRGSVSTGGVGVFGLDPPSFDILARAGAQGCMPYIAPSGTWGFIAGRDQGIRWGDSPYVDSPLRDQPLVPLLAPGDLVYHPGISSDEKWFLAAHSTEQDHNAGPYAVYLYQLEGKSTSAATPLRTGGFNGWPHLWIGPHSAPPPPRPHVDAFIPSSYTLVQGEKVTIQWRTSFADQVTLDGAAVGADGQQELQPSATTIYALEAASSLVTDKDQASVEVTVVAAPTPVSIELFKAEPQSVEAGQSVALSWKVLYAYTLELDGRQIPPSGTLEVSPTQTTRFALTVQGYNGPISREISVTVRMPRQGKPDRGGCMCGTEPGSPWDGVAWVLLLLPLFPLVRRSRRRTPSYL